MKFVVLRVSSTRSLRARVDVALAAPDRVSVTQHSV